MLDNFQYFFLSRLNAFFGNKFSKDYNNIKRNNSIE